MKLVRHGAPGAERPGLIDAEGQIRDLSAHVPDIVAEALSPEVLAALAALDHRRLPLAPSSSRLGPPIGRVPNFICIGLNYVDHAIESGMATPDEPVVFMKATGCLSGPNDDIQLPPGSTATDWEVELGVVIARQARRVPPSSALDHVLGYLVVNDVSERDYQLRRGGSWDKGKSFDTFGPVGPWLVTADEIEDPQALSLWLDVNGVRQQTGSTADMLFSVAELISYVSHVMTLQPGDILATGTPPGVGLGRTPPIALQAGDTVTLGVSGLGTQRQTVVKSPFEAAPA